MNNNLYLENFDYLSNEDLTNIDGGWMGYGMTH